MRNNFYTHTLYPLQDEVIQIITQLETDFYLTGGTAASRGYLQHRYSDDLDFFVNDAQDFTLWANRILQALNSIKKWRVEIFSRYDRFVRANLIQSNTTTLKLEFINDVPSRVGKITVHPVLGKLDSAENILANKLTALLTREEPKDLVDVWGFCSIMMLSLEKAITDAQGKAAGIFPADLSRILLSASREDIEVIQWINKPSPDQFVRDLRKLGENLIFVD